MRIPTLLQKINELAVQPESRTTIDVDLMLDYTRVLYADLLEWRNKISFIAQHATVMPGINEPTLAEMAEAMNEDDDDADSMGPVDQPQVEVSALAKNVQQPGSPNPIQLNPTPTPIQPSSKDIRSLISINDKYQIMSELFGNDSADYENALNQINDAASEAAAVKWLQDRLWVPEERSEAAQGFYELVKRFKTMQAGFAG